MKQWKAKWLQILGMFWATITTTTTTTKRDYYQSISVGNSCNINYIEHESNRDRKKHN